MPRVTCAACGAPSVLGASRCPKCLAPFGGESPTSGVVLVEPPSRTGGATDARRWRAIALAALGLVGVGGLLWSLRTRGQVEPPASPAPAEPVPVDSAPMVLGPTAAGDTGSAAEPGVGGPVPAPRDTSGAPGAVSRGSVGAPVPAGAGVADDSARTFTYETLTWVRVRSAPAVDAEVLATLAPGTRVEVASIGRGWLSLRWEGRAGWVGASLLTRVR
jgi:hypothetical protein